MASAAVDGQTGTGGLLADKAIVLTGASRGLGAAAAKALAEHGASLVLNARDGARLDALRNELEATGARIITVDGSVAEEQVAEALVARCLQEFGRVDVLINNAGIVRDRTTLRMSAEEFDEVMAVNLRGTWLCGREAARAMRESGGGQLINIISNVAFHGSIGQSNYAASKSGAASLTRSWAYELARYGIRANALWPIAMTEMTQVVVENAARAAEQEGKPAPSAATIGLGDPAEVAKMLVYLASDLAAELNGQILTFNGGRLALWTHPQEVEVRERERWSVQQIAEVFSGPDAAQQQAMYEPNLKPLPGA
jgi:NAD(P)-dependent dehydrogenase (short-subunit alcohol dehydrogenase family)